MSFPFFPDRLKCAASILILGFGIYLGLNEQHDLFESYSYGLRFILLSILVLLTTGFIAILNKFFCKAAYRQQIGKLVDWLVLIGSSTILSAILFIAAVKGADHWKYVTARNYVSKAALVLTTIKAENGTYPLSLVEAKLGRLPANLTFSSDGTHYEFLYFDEGGEGILTFGDTERTWHLEAP